MTSSLKRVTAGQINTITYTLEISPDSAPDVTIYSDSARTTAVTGLENVTMTATGDPLVFTFDLPATLAAGTYYPTVTRVFSGVTSTDTNDIIVVEDAGGSVGDPHIVTLADFEARHGTQTAAEQAKITELLYDAEALILDVAAGSDEGWVALTEDAPRAVVRIAVAAAYRAWSNPDGLAQETMADTSVSYGSRGADAMFLTATEVATIRKSAATSKFRAVELVSPWSGTATVDLLGG